MTVPTDHTHIVCSTPKRTRIKVSAKRRTPKELARLAEALDKSPKIKDVSTNLLTGTILVHHEDKSLSDIASIMQDLDVIFKIAPDVEIPTSDGKTIVANQLTDAVADLNQRLGLATNGLLNLRALIPLGLGGLAIVQLLRRGLEIGAAPWYVLAYAAFDSFVKLHYIHDVSPKPAALIQQSTK